MNKYITATLTVAMLSVISTAFGVVEEDTLPDGQKFPFWNDRTVYSREWHVDARRGDDKSGDGSAASPFKTINRAAACVGAGEKVVVHAGIYRETVEALSRGGEGPDRMVAFEAAGDGEVVVSGAVAWNADFIPATLHRQTFVSGLLQLFTQEKSAWTSSNTNARVWSGRFPRSMFKDGENPFAVRICPSLDWVPRVAEGESPSPPQVIRSLLKRGQPFLEHWLCHRGLLFCDGEMMREVLTPQELWAGKTAGEHMYWVADDGREVLFRLRGDASPDGRRFEATVRSQGFAPEKRGLGYVRISGMIFEKFGNGQMPPQNGAVSASCGHHWIVEKCVIRDVHTVGMDLGVQSHWIIWEGPRGFDIVRGCRFERCGIHGVCGVPGSGNRIKNVLVEDCSFDDVGWLYSTHGLTESGAVKFHFADGCLIRRNVFTRLKWGEAVWLDNCVRNNRVTRNAVIDSILSQAAIFVECTREANRVDHNVAVRLTGVNYQPLPATDIVSSGGYFCRGTEADHLLLDGNFIADIERAPFIARGRKPEELRRPLKEYPVLQINDRFERNVVVKRQSCCEITLPGVNNSSAGNIFAFPPDVTPEVKFTVFGRDGSTSVGQSPDDGSRIAVLREMSLDGMRLTVKIDLPGGKTVLDYAGDLSVREDFDRLMEAMEVR